MSTKNSKFRSVLMAGGATIAALSLLAGCGSSQEPKTDDAAVEVEQEQTTVDASAPAENDDAATQNSEATAEDDVFTVIQSVEREYADGVIVDIDREDDGSYYEVDVIEGNEKIELKVSASGEVTEEEREAADEDDVAEASAATVTVTEAIQQALEQAEDDAWFDEAELDEDDDQLRWQIDLDDQDGNDLTELDIPAK